MFNAKPKAPTRLREGGENQGKDSPPRKEKIRKIYANKKERRERKGESQKRKATREEYERGERIRKKGTSSEGGKLAGLERSKGQQGEPSRD